jgi:hypothetical protein
MFCHSWCCSFLLHVVASLIWDPKVYLDFQRYGWSISCLFWSLYICCITCPNDLYFWKSELTRLNQFAYSNPKCSVEVIADISKHIMSWRHQSELSHFCSRSLFPQQNLVSMKLDHMILYNRISNSQTQSHLAGHQGYLYVCNGRYRKRGTYFCEHSESRFLYTGCFKKSFTILKAYRNLYRGHTQRFELSKCSRTHRVLPRIVIRNCFDLFFRFLLHGTSTVTVHRPGKRVLRYSRTSKR